MTTIDQGQTAAALADLARWALEQANAREEQAAARAGLVAAAWQAGCTTVAELARVAGVSRSTIYADLAARGIDLDRPKGTAVSATTATVWHHPHFIRKTVQAGGISYEFRPFTGFEHEPTAPGADQVPLAPGEGFWDRSEEVNAARMLWQAARYEHEMTALMRQAEPALLAYQQAKSGVNAAYAALENTPDGQWRATLFRLAAARRRALDAAAALDYAFGSMRELWDRTRERILDVAARPEKLAEKAGVDLAGFDFLDEVDTYTSMEKEFGEQDRQICEVARLAGDPE